MTIKFTYNPNKLFFIVSGCVCILLYTNRNNSFIESFFLQICTALSITASITKNDFLKFEKDFFSKAINREVLVSKMFGVHFHQEKPPKFWWFFIFFILFF